MTLPRQTGRLVVSRLPGKLQLQVWERATALHRSLERRAGCPVELTLTDNRHAMLNLRPHPRHWEVRAHHLFVDADAVTLDAIAALGRPTTPERARVARAVIRRFATERSAQITPPTPARRVRLRPQGRVHDLEPLYLEVTRKLKQDPEEIQITWGRWGARGAEQRHVRLGSYDPQRRLIRIHPALDQELVPDWVVAFVIFHEVLHHIFPSRKRGGRVIHHSARFRAAEAQHPDHDRYQAWVRDNLWRALAASREPQGRKPTA